MACLLETTDEVKARGNNVLAPTTLIEFPFEGKFEIAHSHFGVGSMELHAVCEGFHALFGFVEGLFAGFGSTKAQACMAGGGEVGAAAIKVGSLDDGCTVAEFAEAYFGCDNVFFEDLERELLAS